MFYNGFINIPIADDHDFIVLKFIADFLLAELAKKYHVYDSAVGCTKHS